MKPEESSIHQRDTRYCPYCHPGPRAGIQKNSPRSTYTNEIRDTSDEIMQNKPNFKFDQMAVTQVLTRTYDKRTLGKRGKNKPNSNPIKPNFQKDGNPPTSLLLTTNDQRPTTSDSRSAKQTQFKAKCSDIHSSNMLLFFQNAYLMCLKALDNI